MSNDARLAAQHRGRVGVRVAHQGEAVEARDAPVHRRIGGEPRLHGEDVGREVAVALLHRVEAGLRAQHGEPGRPHVGRDEVGVRPALQGDLQQVPRVEPQDRPAVRRDVADRPEPLADAARRLQVGGVDQVMDLPRPVPLLVDGGDLHLQQEADRAVARRREPRARSPARSRAAGGTGPGSAGTSLLADLLEPRRMGEVAGSDDRDPLAPRPEGKMLQIRVPARRPGVFGVDVEIGVEAHGMDSRNRRNGIPGMAVLSIRVF